MHSLITSYLLQSKECVLPGIGVLQVIHTPASTDVPNNRILPPSEEIIFKKEDHSKSPGLTKAIAYKKDIEESKAENLLDNFCKEWEERINKGEKLTFETVGSIQKNADGVITFERGNIFNYLQPISVNNPYHRTEQPVSIDEAPPVSEVFEEKNDDVVVERSYWGFWALILLAVGSLMLFFHFKDHKLSGSTVGNQKRFAIDSAKATYNVPNK
jgi:nucleoid DNA-binding protein